MSVLDRKPPARLMAAFDELPEKVRRAVAEADFAYDPEWVAERIAKGRRAAAFAEAVRERTERRMRRI